MKLLPSQQKEAVKRALIELEESGSMIIYEPCDCGSWIRHNNGGNYHEIIELARDSGEWWVKRDTTCELVAPAEWEECADPKAIIREHADWL